MSNSIDYILLKKDAIENVKDTLNVNGISIIEEKEINNGLGYKLTCFLGSKFGMIIYFKSGVSSKIVFENAPQDVMSLFSIESPTKNVVLTINQPTVPIHAVIKITTADRQTAIKGGILSVFQDAVESKPNDAIKYKLSIKKGEYKFTITQYNNGTLLMQGTASPIFNEIKDIIQSINPLTDMENSLLYIPKDEKTVVEEAFKKVPEIFKGLYEKAQLRISKDAFDFLFENDRQTLISSIGILEAVKQTDLKIPLYNPILFPFAKVYEGFIIRLLIEKCFFSFEEYKKNPDIAQIGNALKGKKLEKYIKDIRRNGGVLDNLKMVWEDLRCHELHSDPAQDDEIIGLTDIQQVENRIGQISTAIMDGYRILVKCGYTEAEMLQNKPITEKENENHIKEIPAYESHIGTDESGKGDYFGPLVIAGVFTDSAIEKTLVAIGVQDSKKNSDRKNRELAIKIKQIIEPEKFSVVFINPEKYNSLYSKMKNLNVLLAWGHARALENILNKTPCENAIADQFGNEEYIKKALLENGKSINLLQTPKAERDLAVAAASILARDMYLQQLELLEKKSGIQLFKGASEMVEKAAKEIVEKYGESELGKFAKLHFKTTERIIK